MPFKNILLDETFLFSGKFWFFNIIYYAFKILFDKSIATL